MKNARQVYIISDLHIGGAYPQSKEDLGFRMMTHPDELATFIQNLAKMSIQPKVELVINGDFIDFLAEEHPLPTRWTSFLSDGKEAAATLRQVIDRSQDKVIFEALGEHLRRGHALTILLGNHDIELSLPEVRATFEKALGIDRSYYYRFIYDGEGYQIGDVLIEHGNRYDPVNIVDHDGLRRIRSLRSRRQYKYLTGHFRPPAGSRIVAKVMNPIKADYRFIDLLKPSSKPLFALLLAIEPSYLKKLDELAKALITVPRHLMDEPALPSYKGDIAARESSPTKNYKADIRARKSENESALKQIIAETMGDTLASEMLKPGRYKQDIAHRIGDSHLGLAKLFIKGNSAKIEQRLRWIQQTMRVLQNDQSFDDGVEPSLQYLEAATALAGRSKNFRFVVFGHTHHAKDVELSGGARYLNSGTWANFMRFPKEIVGDNKTLALKALRSFFEDLRKNNLNDYIEFRPTYIRLDVSDKGKVIDASLREFKR